MERQSGQTLEEVRKDHLNRYYYAKDYLVTNGLTESVLDLGCGTGYGSAILSEVVSQITSVELSREAFEIYQNYYKKPNINFINDNALSLSHDCKFDAVVCFEFIEHIVKSIEVIRLISSITDVVIMSTPNERIRPHKKPPINPFHVRHYTPEELEELFSVGGFSITEWKCQTSRSKPTVIPGTKGKFIIAVGRK